MILAFTLGCLAIATGARAEGVRFGPTIAFPIPGDDVGDTQLGVDAGLTLNRMLNPHAGVGLDFAYHYWPTSSEYMADYDRYLQSWFQTFDSSTWAFSAFSLSAHLKVVGPAMKGQAPWVQVGAGLYRLNRNLAETSWEGSPVVVLRGAPNRIVVVPGWQGSAGVDFRTSSTLVLGLMATYQSLWEESERTAWGDTMKIPGFSSFSIGAYILFGK